jgi:toxin ParE1/3/4
MAIIRKQALAERDLKAIWHYTFHMWGDKQADVYLDELGKAFELLAEQPYLGRERREFVPVVRTFSHAHHLIVYQVIKNGIQIIRVLHKGMDVDTIFSATFL